MIYECDSIISNCPFYFKDLLRPMHWRNNNEHDKMIYHSNIMKTWFIFQNSVFFVFLTNHDMCVSNDKRKCDHSLMTLMSLHILLMCTGDSKVFQVIFNCHRFFTYKIRLKSSSFLFISRKFYFLEINWSSSNDINAL